MRSTEGLKAKTHQTSTGGGYRMLGMVMKARSFNHNEAFIPASAEFVNQRRENAHGLFGMKGSQKKYSEHENHKKTLMEGWRKLMRMLPHF